MTLNLFVANEDRGGLLNDAAFSGSAPPGVFLQLLLVLHFPTLSVRVEERLTDILLLVVVFDAAK